MDPRLDTAPVSYVPAGVSPLVLADRLITMAQEADRAGFPRAASHLVTAMYAVLDTPRAARH